MFKFFLFLQCFLMSQVVCAKSLYVSKDGSDIGLGTFDKPLATLNGARNWIRKFKKTLEYEKNKSNIIVYIRGGDYLLTNSFILNKEDSGEDSFVIKYEAFQNEKVRFTGGVEFNLKMLSGIDKEEVSEELPQRAYHNVRRLDLSSININNLSTFNWNRLEPKKVGSEPIAPEELFVEDKPMLLARWPNETWAETGKDNAVFFQKEQSNARNVFHFIDERVKKWGNDSWVFGFWNWDWFDQALQIKNINFESRLIYLKNSHYYGIGEKKRFYVFNTLSELDHEDEYYIDRKKNILYYWVSKSGRDQVLSLSLLNKPLFKLNNVSNIQFNKITLDQGRDSGIEIINSQNIRITDSTIKNIGNTGIIILGGEKVTVHHSEIFNTGTRGIYISGGDRKKLVASSHQISDNFIHHFGRRIYSQSYGVEVHGVGQIISNNIISNAPHIGIRFYGNDHVIEFNQIHDVCLETSDAGAIYTGRDWSARGTIIRHNLIYDIKGLNSNSDVMGVYLDDFSSGINIYGNVFSRVHRGVLIGGGRDNNIKGNVFYKNDIPISIDSRGRGWAKNSMTKGSELRISLKKVPYQSKIWRRKYPNLEMILLDEPGIPKGNFINSNYMLSSGEVKIDQLAFLHTDIGNNHLLNDNPGFVNLEDNGFTIKNKSPADDFLEKWKDLKKRKFN